MIRILFTVLLFSALDVRAAQTPPLEPQTALVYAGPGACEDGKCAQFAADVAIRAGLQVRFVTPGMITAQTFQDAAVWIQPGGDSITVTKALSDTEKTLIRGFIDAGGGYLGFCAGAYLASTEIDKGIYGLGLLSGAVDDYSPGNKGAFILQVLWNFHYRDLYFEDGPFFKIGQINDYPVAFYPDGKIAALKTSYGHGHVSVSGPHPEAPPSWSRTIDPKDTDGVDYDLAHDLLNWAIKSHAPMKNPNYSSEEAKQSSAQEK